MSWGWGVLVRFVAEGAALVGGLKYGLRGHVQKRLVILILHSVHVLEVKVTIARMHNLILVYQALQPRGTLIIITIGLNEVRLNEEWALRASKQVSEVSDHLQWVPVLVHIRVSSKERSSLTLFTSGCGRRCKELLFVIPDGRGPSLIVSLVLSKVAGVRWPKEFEKVQFERSRVEFTKDAVRVVDLGVLLLVDDHAIEELHIGAPPGDRL